MAAEFSFKLYHRTVIVTAAVHWSFRREPPPCEGHPQRLTYQHWAGVSPYTLAFAFAETYVLDKQSLNKLLLWPRAERKKILISKS